MDLEKNFTRIATLIGEPTRATMLWNLLDGRAYTAGELALCADVSAQSASNHLTKLVMGELLSMEKQGRHRYYRLAKPEIAYTIESIANLFPLKAKSAEMQTREKAGIEYARTCYDHLAGVAGVMVTQALIEKKILIPAGKGYRVSRDGERWFAKLGIDVEDLTGSKRSFARQCLDWSERKHHVAGALGAALLQRMIELDWIRKKQFSREVFFSYKGRGKLYSLLGLSLR
jgi:DNA-binding transcriptional ArsR family regulator